MWKYIEQLQLQIRAVCSSVYVDIQSVQDDEEEEQPNYSSLTSDNQGQRGGTSRGWGGGSRGRGYNNNDKHPSGRGVTQFKDSEGINQYQQGQDGKILLNERGHLSCNYCGISSHTRSSCRNRLRDLENGIKRNFHPNRGQMSSNNQIRKANQTKQSVDQWNNCSTTPPTPQAPKTAMAQSVYGTSIYYVSRFSGFFD